MPAATAAIAELFAHLALFSIIELTIMIGVEAVQHFLSARLTLLVIQTHATAPPIPASHALTLSGAA
jgi:hypothetical protein